MCECHWDGIGEHCIFLLEILTQLQFLAITPSNISRKIEWSLKFSFPTPTFPPWCLTSSKQSMANKWSIPGSSPISWKIVMPASKALKKSGVYINRYFKCSKPVHIYTWLLLHYSTVLSALISTISNDYQTVLTMVQILFQWFPWDQVCPKIPSTFMLPK